MSNDLTMIIFLIAIAIILLFLFYLMNKVDQMPAPDYKLRTYSHRKVVRSVILEAIVILVLSIPIYWYSKAFDTTISIIAFLLCIPLAHLAWGIFFQSTEKRRGAKRLD
jgi:nucleoside recognition membrane protein YjiH